MKMSMDYLLTSIMPWTEENKIRCLRKSLVFSKNFDATEPQQ